MNKRFFLAFTIFTLLSLSSSLRAQEVSGSLVSQSSELSVSTSSVTTPSAPVQPTDGGLISQNLESVSFSLAIVLLIIFFLAWLVRKAVPGSLGVSKGQMKVLSTLPLGGKERIMLVDVAGTQMVLGVSAAGVNCLHVFTETVIVNEGNSFSSPQGFQAILQGFIANKATNKDSN